MKVTVFGAGYVGLVAAACLAEMGNHVVNIDPDEARVARLLNGEMPLHEAGLAELVQRNAAAGRLHFSSDAVAGVAHGTLMLVAVGTPSGVDGQVDLSQVLAVADTVAAHMSDYKVIVHKSTVPVGTADRVRERVAAALRARRCALPFAVVANPEFLKEGMAVQDFMSPDRVIVGADDDRALFLLRALYAPFLRQRDRMLTLSPRSAELSKYAANAMLAARISFMNEMALLAEQVGADIEQVRQGVGSDPRIGPSFLYAGCGWGGSCFPKDVQALAALGEQHGLPMASVRAAMDVNTRQRALLAERVLQRWGAHAAGRQVALWGLAFKPGTDDLREAPSRVVIDRLLAAGVQVCAYDPVAMPAARAQWGELPGLRYADDPYGALEQADALIVVTEWREFRSPDFDRLRDTLRGALVLDGRNLYDPALLARFGLECQGIGRAAFQAEAALDEVPTLLRA